MMLDLAKRTVIVVDDEAFTRQTVARLLAGLGATNIVQAEDGEAALAESWTIAAGPVLVISDFNMPKIDGLNLLKSVRMGQSGFHRAVPFVMLTGFSDRDVVDAALKLDVSAFLLKPVSKAALEKRLNHLARSEAEKGWLKPVDIYSVVVTDMAPDVLAPPDRTKDEPSAAIAAAKPGARKSSNGGGSSGGLRRDTEDSAQSLARGPSDASDAGAELLKFLLSNKQGGADAAPDDEAGDGQGQSNLLNIATHDAALTGAMTAGIDGLVAEIGQTAADRITSALERLVSGAALSPADVIDVLQDKGDKVTPEAMTVARDWSEQTRSLGDIPKIAILTKNIFMRDGTLLLATGAPLTGTPLRVLRRLERLGILDLPSDPQLGRCLVRLVAPPEAKQPGRAPPRMAPRPVATPARRKGPERAVGPTEISAGMVVSRDIHTIHGAIYLGAGTTLTERHVGVLESLYEAGKLTSKIWVNA
ncbi:MAG: response regulator [Rhodospirillales bacterium]|nr:response regulator [Rhodospirillales bacterium]